MKRLCIAFIAIAVACFGQVNIVQFQASPPSSVRSNTISATVSGVAGSQQYYYWVVANYPIGSTFPGGPILVRDVPDTLGGANFVTINWAGQAGATSYDVLRTTAPNYPSGTANTAVATGVVGTTQIDNSNVVAAYTLGARTGASGYLRLDNQNYAVPTFVLNPGLEVQGNLNVTGIFTGSFGFTQGSVPFADAAGSLAEDNPNLFWDDTNDRLGIGTASPSSKLYIEGASGSTLINIAKDDGTSRFSVTADGSITTNANISLQSNKSITADGGSIVLDKATTDDLEISTSKGDVVLQPTTGNVGIGTNAPTGLFDVVDRTPVTGDTLVQVGWDGTTPSATTTQMLIAEGTAQANVSQILFTDNAGANPVGIDRNAAGVLEVNNGVANNITGDLAYEQWIGTAVLFAALGAPANGTFVYCSDCTIANPCAGGGNGALAKRLNGIWVCN